MWCQEKLAAGQFALRKKHSSLNRADVGTKALDGTTMWRLLGLCNISSESGRPNGAVLLLGFLSLLFDKAGGTPIEDYSNKKE